MLRMSEKFDKRGRGVRIDSTFRMQYFNDRRMRMTFIKIASESIIFAFIFW
jgi:hypothetical protein